ncbi:hypothetical protein KO561_11395 [Radiobacillus kanasensis]|uniref:hypothetical protein n=1 Tax=Radiobacillus kanasensis TaxID=2844358 RepID=UPI001E611FCE|nr:hypothetical protein [Radiobacillus kanasensis]UFT97817.1 hypothetical protein KO561_11395 [Radiobacillus kanasensis]
MDDIIGILFAVIAIAGGIFGMFQKDKDTGKIPNPKPTSTPSGPMQQESKPHMETAELEGAHTLQQQYEEMKHKSSSSLNTHRNERISSIRNRKTKKIDRQATSFLSEELKGKALAKNIVMTEVLGPPRALKPYQSQFHRNRR